MMNFLYRSAPPPYKGCSPHASHATYRTNSGLWSVLAGGGRPAYRQRGGGGTTAPGAVCGWWPAFFGGNVAYRKAPERVHAAEESTVVDAETAIREGWLRDEDEVETALREIHIW